MNSCLVIPCYNEAPRLKGEALLAFLEQRPDFTLLLVDDGSQDATWARIEELTKKHSRLKGLRLSHNQGKAEAVRQGTLQALQSPDLKFVGYFDADLATPLAEADRMLRYFHDHPAYQIILGSRLKKLGNKIQRLASRHVLGRIFATVVSSMLRLPVYDTQCGAKLFRAPKARELFAKPFVSPWFFDVELLARHQLGNGRADEVFEMPLKEWTHVPGSKLRAKDYLSVPFELFKIWRTYFF